MTLDEFTAAFYAPEYPAPGWLARRETALYFMVPKLIDLARAAETFIDGQGDAWKFEELNKITAEIMGTEPRKF